MKYSVINKSVIFSLTLALVAQPHLCLAKKTAAPKSSATTKDSDPLVEKLESSDKKIEKNSGDIKGLKEKVSSLEKEKGPDIKTAKELTDKLDNQIKNINSAAEKLESGNQNLEKFLKEASNMSDEEKDFVLKLLAKQKRINTQWLERKRLEKSLQTIKTIKSWGNTILKWGTFGGIALYLGNKGLEIYQASQDPEKLAGLLAKKITPIIIDNNNNNNNNNNNDSDVPEIIDPKDDD